MRFGANCSAKASILAIIFCGYGCKFGSIFLQIEMQKHSNWQKSERKARNVGRRFHHSGAFYIGFARQFLLEWFAKKLRFVKYAYLFNNSFTCQLQCPIWVKACSNHSPQRLNCCSWYCSSLFFCFYLASFAYVFSGIVEVI